MWLKYHESAIPQNYFTRTTGFAMPLSKVRGLGGAMGTLRGSASHSTLGYATTCSCNGFTRSWACVPPPVLNPKGSQFATLGSYSLCSSDGRDEPSLFIHHTLLLQLPFHSACLPFHPLHILPPDGPSSPLRPSAVLYPCCSCWSRTSHCARRTCCPLHPP